MCLSTGPRPGPSRAARSRLPLHPQGLIFGYVVPSHCTTPTGFACLSLLQEHIRERSWIFSKGRKYASVVFAKPFTFPGFRFFSRNFSGCGKKHMELVLVTSNGFALDRVQPLPLSRCGTVPSPQKETPSARAVTPFLPPAPGNLSSAFCLFAFACSGCFT